MRCLRGYPCTPTKQYTRRWRLYHFCGFYYPIREVIPIAIYHWNIGIVSRGKGKSAVAAAAYRSGEKLTNEWDGMTHDYTRKGGVVYTEIMLPPHAPPSFSDRSTLWNSVELYEKAGNAQLAREIDAALPIELSREEQIRLVREYCSSQFVSKGMCVDFVIHDTNSGNPHCHIMLTMRPLDERGAWAAKSKKEYDLDENGERIRLPSGRYKTHKVDLTGWNSKDNTLLWRKAWADFTNDFLERNGSPERIDHRSNAERGIDEIPTVHMGVAACQMEKKGIAEYAKHDRAEFVRVVQEAQSSQQTAEVKKQRTRLATAKQRVSELEVLLCKIYEDNILGKLSDSRYATLDAQYEKEQSELTAEISVLEKAVKSYEKHEKDADRFIALIDKYENFDKLTIAMLNEFIEKILVHERDRKGSIQTTQEVEIYFNFVGRFVPPAFGEAELTPEELEEIRKREERKDRLHQNYLKRKANGKQKEYEERTKAKKKAEIEARKQAIRTEDIARGVFIPVSSLPQLGPRKGA